MASTAAAAAAAPNAAAATMASTAADAAAAAAAATDDQLPQTESVEKLLAAGVALLPYRPPNLGDDRKRRKPASDDDSSGASAASDEQTPKDTEDEDECTFCMEVLAPVNSDAVTLRICNHRFHASCLAQWMKEGTLTCPICNKTASSAPRCGKQPRNGTMTIYREARHSLPGFPNCGSLIINYSFPPGIQGPEHPSPGKPYPGEQRTALLPDNEEGRTILALFKVAFKRRLLFTIAESVTLGPAYGEKIVWYVGRACVGRVTETESFLGLDRALRFGLPVGSSFLPSFLLALFRRWLIRAGIHHKTSTTGTFGYPDPTYFDRVKEELRSVGVTEADIVDGVQ